MSHEIPYYKQVCKHSKICQQFADSLNENLDNGGPFITFINTGEPGEETVYFIRGKPYFVDDGDDRQDEMSASTEIFYCPFCGNKI